MAEFTCENMVNRPGSDSGVRPMPVSRMAMTSSAFSMRAYSAIWPSGSVYLAALVSRLPMTCDRRSGSASSLTFSGRQVDRELVLLGVEQRARRFHRDADDGLEVDVVLLELELAARDARHVEQVVEQQRHALHLARDDFAAPLALAVVGRVRIEDAHGVANGRERIAQLVRQRGEELVLAPVGLEQRALGVLEAADVEIDAGPALDAPGLVADGHALREDGVVLPVDAHACGVRDTRCLPVRARFLPRRHGVLDVVRVQDAAPAVVRRLLHA